jgi:K(+)-stimulated pyrophosphate-energized sodium pump
MSVVALVIAPSLVNDAAVTAYLDKGDEVEHVEIEREVNVEMNQNEDGTVKAVVSTVTTQNGETATTYETFEGEEAEVKAKIDALKEDSNVIKTKKIIKEVEKEIVK